MFKDAWWMVQKELRFQRFTVLFTFLSTAFIGGVTAYYFKEAILHSKNEFLLHYLLDIIFWLIVPNFVTLYTAGYYLDFRSKQENPLSQMMAFYRSCPIPLGTLTLSRIVKTLFLFFTQSLLFYAFFLAQLHMSGYPIFTNELCLFILASIGLGLALGSVIPYVEYGRSMKAVYTVCFVWILLFLIIRPALYWIVDKSITQWIWLGIQQIGIPFALVALIIGCLSFSFWNRRLFVRLQSRDYL